MHQVIGRVRIRLRNLKRAEIVRYLGDRVSEIADNLCLDRRLLNKSDRFNVQDLLIGWQFINCRDSWRENSPYGFFTISELKKYFFFGLIFGDVLDAQKKAVGNRLLCRVTVAAVLSVQAAYDTPEIRRVQFCFRLGQFFFEF